MQNHLHSNITDEDLAEIKKNLRGELSIMINNEEAMIFSYYDEENDKTIFNGFICEDETIRDMEEDFLEGIVIDSGIIGDVYELYDDYDDDYDDAILGINFSSINSNLSFIFTGLFSSSPIINQSIILFFEILFLNFHPYF